MQSLFSGHYNSLSVIAILTTLSMWGIRLSLLRLIHSSNHEVIVWLWLLLSWIEGNIGWVDNSRLVQCIALSTLWCGYHHIGLIKLRSPFIRMFSIRMGWWHIVHYHIIGCFLSSDGSTHDVPFVSLQTLLRVLWLAFHARVLVIKLIHLNGSRCIFPFMFFIIGSRKMSNGCRYIFLGTTRFIVGLTLFLGHVFARINILNILESLLSSL